MTRARLISDIDEFPQGTEDAPPTTDQPGAVERNATEIVMLALTALSKRFVVAIENLFVLITAASVFWIWMSIIETATYPQIGAATLYSAFILALNRWGRREMRR